ncbi:MAG: hypothetical protein Q9159_004456 [Coniocarpon cinnabarinum]
MGRLQEIPRTATFAWSPDVTTPRIVTGTRAGAVDEGFSDETKLELWTAESKGTGEATPIASIDSDSRFYDIAWSESSKEHPEGVIAVALENGSLDLYDAQKLAGGDGEAARLARTTKHTGAIKCLQFNPHRPELLASAGAKGELYITDLSNPESPSRVGAAAGRADDFDTIDWNKKVPHILVTGSAGGFVTVWDIKAKKESLTLNNYGRKPVSAIAWNPDVPTKLATAVPLDQDPLILLWDLRNSSQPERILRGHDQGVLSLSWCALDNDLLLSSGKDNRNICWNPHTGHILGEFPIVLNAAFQTRWCPRQPNLLATASFDNKIRIETIQNTNAKATADGAGASQQSLDADDFFATAQTQPQTSSFTLPAAPKWMKRPVGVSFGFGGRIVTFCEPSGQKSKIKLDTFVSDSSVESSIAQFRDALRSADVSSLCDSKIENATDDDAKEDWKAIRTLLSESPRKQILTHLGFDPDAASKSQLATNGETDRVDGELGSAEDEAKKKENRLSQFFSGDNTNFLTDLASSKGVKTNNPFHITTSDESEADRQITRALMLGSFEEALNLCLQEKRMSDAFMIAICGGQKCIDKAQAAYFSQQSSSPNYVRLLASVVGKNLWDVVHNADIQNWKETMAILCTYADEEEFSDLCEALGDRLEDSEATRKNASFCYLAGSKLEKVVPVWSREMQEHEADRTEEAGDDSAFSIHVQALQSFVEKVSIFRRAAQYQDRADQQEDESAYKLDLLYSKYAEYADVVAAHGHLDLAEEYVNLLPDKYAAAEAARTRIQQALNKKPTVGARTSSRPVPASDPLKGATPGPSTARPPVPMAPNSYAPTNAYAPPNNAPQPTYANAASANAYAPTGPYAPVGAYQPSGPSFAPAPNATGPPPAAGHVPPPPRGQVDKGPNWNDLPDGVSKPARSGRGTPVVPGPFASQPNPYGPPTSSSPSYSQPPQNASAPLPPPPKAGQPPPRISSPPSAVPPLTMQPPPRPSSSAANAYAPPPSSSMPAPTTSLPQRSASPYNPPPSGGPPSSRYAPAPTAPGGMPPTAGAAPPPPMGAGGRPPVAANPYAAQGQYAPMQQQQQQQPPPPGAPPPGPGPPPMAAPPRGGPPSRPPTGPPPTGSARPGSSTSQGSASQATPRHPPGDRSHIPVEAQPIFDVIHPEMQRIKARAPANFKPQVDDTEKRLNILFDGLNNLTIPQEAVAKMRDLAGVMQSRDFERAQGLHGELLREVEGGGSWLVGVKRLISMSRATPV